MPPTFPASDLSLYPGLYQQSAPFIPPTDLRVPLAHPSQSLNDLLDRHSQDNNQPMDSFSLLMKSLQANRSAVGAAQNAAQNAHMMQAAQMDRLHYPSTFGSQIPPISQSYFCSAPGSPNMIAHSDSGSMDANTEVYVDGLPFEASREDVFSLFSQVSNHGMRKAGVC
jgi:hypothetical protein